MLVPAMVSAAKAARPAPRNLPENRDFSEVCDGVAFHILETDILFLLSLVRRGRSLRAPRDHSLSLVGQSNPPEKRLKGGRLRCGENLIFTIG
jgi:hypothetical protein